MNIPILDDAYMDRRRHEVEVQIQVELWNAMHPRVWEPEATNTPEAFLEQYLGGSIDLDEYERKLNKYHGIEPRVRSSS